jgi:hypothetical protein
MIVIVRFLGPIEPIAATHSANLAANNRARQVPVDNS